ncbi:MAG: glycosyltransferase family 4 protein [bacterium]|nr:glycosyltransferase family 4 protein [bacterium]
MEDQKKMVFVSNYINHHQIPFCNAMYRILRSSFLFVQTEPMERERVEMGWKEETEVPYLKRYYEEPKECQRLIDTARTVLFGGCEEESYVESRLERKLPVIRCSERLYRTGQWKAVSPRGLRKKYHDHTRHKNDPVYLLCAGAYVASDFHIVRAYPGKMYCWGYFPETRHYDLETLLNGKGWPGKAGSGIGETISGKAEIGIDKAVLGKKVPYLLWAARMIDLKHPELAMETARYLKEKGLAFHMDIIGGGDRMEGLEAARVRYGLEDQVSLPGSMTPDQVREHMERADIFLFTSDRQEGWGAVANEAMNSGCALIADHMIGAAPFLIQNGRNGLIYRDGDKGQLFALTERLVRDKKLCRRLGENAYRTVTEEWNAEQAAERLALLCASLGILNAEDLEITDVEGQLGRFQDSLREGTLTGPCAPARVLQERGRASRELYTAEE